MHAPGPFPVNLPGAFPAFPGPCGTKTGWDIHPYRPLELLVNDEYMHRSHEAPGKKRRDKDQNNNIKNPFASHIHKIARLEKRKKKRKEGRIYFIRPSLLLRWIVRAEGNLLLELL